MQMKQDLVADIRKTLDEYNNLFVFSIYNMRNGPLKELREQWKDSRFVFAKRRIMAIALGRTQAEETQKNLYKLSLQLAGQCGLLFTNKPKDEVVQWFHDYSLMDFAKSGFVATETVKLPEGPLPDFCPALENRLRLLGLPTKLEKGKVILREEHTVCTEGNKLRPDQANILKLLGKKMAEFKVSLLYAWSKDGSFEKFKVPKELKKREKTSKVDTDEVTPKRDLTETPMPVDIENSKTPVVGSAGTTKPAKSPNVTKAIPRRSMRVPKPLKRTPEQRRLSVKKLTESAGQIKETPKPLATPKQKIIAKRPQNRTQDIEMAE